MCADFGGAERGLSVVTRKEGALDCLQESRRIDEDDTGNHFIGEIRHFLRDLIGELCQFRNRRIRLRLDVREHVLNVVNCVRDGIFDVFDPLLRGVDAVDYGLNPSVKLTSSIACYAVAGRANIAFIFPIISILAAPRSIRW